VYEGFYFTATGAIFASPRVQLRIAQAEIWTQWCAMQTPVPQYGGIADGGCGALYRYGCLPNVGITWDTTTTPATCKIASCVDPTWAPVDCGKFRLCTSPQDSPGMHSWLTACDCTATACTVRLVGSPTLAFDMQLASGTLNGSVLGLDSQAHNVHLTRSQ
jgi:hypothetical protein